MDPNTGELMSLLEAEKARAEGRRVVELIGSENDVRSMGDTEAMRQALEHARRVLLKVAHADGDLHGDAWAAVWHADSALAFTEAPEPEGVPEDPAQKTSTTRRVPTVRGLLEP